jgi:cell wall-associated NlpC family hydrolase
MRRGRALLVFGVLAAVVGLVSARASGAGTTTTTETTTGTTTTSTTTTTASPTYARLVPSYLPAACVGAGAAAIYEPGSTVLTLGTPTSGRGPSAYPANASVVAFGSSSGGGSTCQSGQVTLESVSLLGGFVTASSVVATDGRGTVSGLEIGGSAVSLGAGQTAPISFWGQVTLGKTVDRLTAPLVVELLARHAGLPAGTTIAVAFAASAQPVAKPKPTHHAAASAGHNHKAQTGGSQNQAGGASKTRKNHQHLSKPPPDFPTAPFPFALSGGLSPAAQDNSVVSSAMQYLGVPYKWAGASPKTGFDCSGLVTYVFARLGVSLPHYTVAQWHSPDGVWVAPNRLQPGDLVFFIGSDGTRKAPGHVGIYAGDGYIIDAPHTGSFVRIDSLSEPRLANGYVGARRIVSPMFVARRLSRVTKPGASDTAIPPGFTTPTTISFVKPLGMAVASTAVARAPSRGYRIWAGVALAGLLLLLVPGGAFAFRRRRHTPDVPTSG